MTCGDAPGEGCGGRASCPRSSCLWARRMMGREGASGAAGLHPSEEGRGSHACMVTRGSHLDVYGMRESVWNGELSKDFRYLPFKY